MSHSLQNLTTHQPETGARIHTLREFSKLLSIFQDHNHCELDTARSYNAGEQEKFTCFTNYESRGFKLATKAFPDPSSTQTQSPDHVTDLNAQLGISLRELGTECVDIFYLHAPTRSVPFEVTLKAIDELHRQGKFVKFGISNFASFEVAEIVMLCQQNGWVQPMVYQGEYSALSRSVEAELLPCLRRYGIAFHAYSPLAGGLLTDRYVSSLSDSSTPKDGRFSEASGKLGEGYREMYFHDRNFQAVKLISEEAKKHDITMLQAALRWMVHHSPLEVRNNGPDGIIIGVSSEKQLRENLEAIEQGPLPKELVDKLDEAWKIARVDANNYWYGKLEYGYDTSEALFGCQRDKT